MKKLSIITSLFACLLFLTACETDNDSNPVLQKPTTFVLNTPALANTTYDLAYSNTIGLTCSQPNYGFPVETTYAVQVSLDQDFTKSVELDTKYKSTRLNVDASEMAVALTNLEVEEGLLEDAFPLDIPVYVRLRAYVSNTQNIIEGSEILSNTITLNNVHLAFSLPAVTTPENLYITGQFCSWSWDDGQCLKMVPVNGATNVFWHMVYIDGSGIKFNMSQDWGGTQVGYQSANTTFHDNAGAGLIDTDNIAATNEGWYLLIVETSVSGRDILYDVQINKPEVWLMGTVTAKADWSECEEGMSFTVPTTADGEFVSPAFPNSTSGDGGLRAYVKVPGFDWWKSEFIFFSDGKIVYRGNGGDQDRIDGTAGQKMYLNFGKETGRLE